jgi:hypothetical protein
MWVIRYDLASIDFRPWAQDALGVDDLAVLHLFPDRRYFDNYVERLQYHVGQLCDEFFQVEPLYQQLVHNVISPLFGGISRYQSLIPSFRCHLAGAGTVSAFHRDGEEQYGLYQDAINAWCPLTPAFESNSIFVETCVGSDRYHPVRLEPGEILLFDAYHRRHGSVRNLTDRTRVSFDLRFVPIDKALASEMGLYPLGHGFASNAC